MDELQNFFLISFQLLNRFIRLVFPQFLASLVEFLDQLSEVFILTLAFMFEFLAFGSFAFGGLASAVIVECNFGQADQVTNLYPALRWGGRGLSYCVMSRD